MCHNFWLDSALDIAQVTLKVIDFHHLKSSLLDRSIKKNVLILGTEALTASVEALENVLLFKCGQLRTQLKDFLL